MDDYSNHCWEDLFESFKRDSESSHQKGKILFILVSVYDDKINFFVIIL